MKASIVFLSGLFLFTLAEPGPCSEKMVLCAANYPPWIIVEDTKGKKLSGLSINIMKEISNRLDIEFELSALPFKRCLAYTENCAVDGCFMTIKNAKRESYADYTDYYVAVPSYVFYLSDAFTDFQWEKWQDLIGYAIGIQRAFRYGPEFSHAAEKYKYDLIPSNDIVSSLKMALLKRVDLVVINKYRFNYLAGIHPAFSDKFKSADKSVGTGYFYMAISKKSRFRTMVPGINRIIRQMKDDGTIEKLISVNSTL